jgi:hypothetical protein
MAKPETVATLLGTIPGELTRLSRRGIISKIANGKLPRDAAIAAYVGQPIGSVMLEREKSSCAPRSGRDR